MIRPALIPETGEARDARGRAEDDAPALSPGAAAAGAIVRREGPGDDHAPGVTANDVRPPDARSDAAWWRAPLGWTLVAFALRLLLLSGVEHVISPDGVVYLNLGRNLAAGNLVGGLSTFYPPLYPLLVGLASLWLGEPEFAGRFVSVVAGALLVVPAHRLARVWYGRRAGALCAGLVALHPLLVYYSTVLLTEATYTLLFTCGILAGWTAVSTARARAHLLAGAAFGACYLLKPEAAGFLLLLAAHTLVAAKFFGGGFSAARCARNLLALCAGFLLFALPYLLYLRRETGAWTISGKLAGHLWQGTRRAGDIAPPAATFVPDWATAVSQLAKALRHEYEVFNLIFPVGFVLLAGLGLFRRGWARERARREFYLFSFVAAALAGYAVTLPNIRFVVPLLPLLLCWVALGLVEFEGWAAETLGGRRRSGPLLPRARKLVAPIVVAGLVASLLPLFVYLLRGDKWGDYYGQKLAAVWIREQGGAEAPAVMSTAPVAAFYAGGRHVPLVDEDYAAFIGRARRAGAAYVVVNERSVWRMSLSPLLDERRPHPGLRPAHNLTVAPGHKIVVYAVEPESDADASRGGRP
jgi:4-amino-4-deoxy-L-arabinose transferase-like glycosyltransferase